MALSIAGSQQVAEAFLSEQNVDHRGAPVLVAEQRGPLTCPVEQAQRVDEPVEALGAGSRLEAIVDGLRPLLGETEVLRQPIEPVIELRRMQLFECAPDTRVEIGALMLEKACIGGFLHECMGELVGVLRENGGLTNDPGGGKSVQRGRDPVRVDEHAHENLSREVAAHDRRRAQHLTDFEIESSRAATE